MMFLMSNTKVDDWMQQATSRGNKMSSNFKQIKRKKTKIVRLLMQNFYFVNQKGIILWLWFGIARTLFLKSLTHSTKWTWIVWWQIFKEQINTIFFCLVHFCCFVLFGDMLVQVINLCKFITANNASEHVFILTIFIEFAQFFGHCWMRLGWNETLTIFVLWLETVGMIVRIPWKILLS